MNSNQLREYVRELNKQEALIKEVRRQQALNKIKLLREKIRNDKHIANIE